MSTEQVLRPPVPEPMTYNGHRLRDLNIILQPRAELDWPDFFAGWDRVVEFQRASPTGIEPCRWPDWCGCWTETQEIDGHRAALELVHRHVALNAGQGTRLSDEPACAFPKPCEICKWQKNNLFCKEPSKVHERTEEEWVAYELEIAAEVRAHIEREYLFPSGLGVGLYSQEHPDDVYNFFWLRYLAKTKANELLASILSDSEWKALEDTKGVWVKSPTIESRKYFVSYPNAHITVYENGTKIGSLCVHSIGEERGVQEDEVVAALLGLEFDEERMLKDGAFHGVFPEAPVVVDTAMEVMEITLVAAGAA